MASRRPLQSNRLAANVQGSALVRGPCPRPHSRPRPRPGRAPPPAGHHRCQPGLPPRHPGDPHHPPGPVACQPALAHRDRVRGHQPHRRPGQPRPPRRLDPEVTGASRRCTTSATPPSPRTPARSAPAPHPGPWPACVTSPSASCTPAATQHRRRAAPQRPQRHPGPAAAGRHKPVNQTLRHSTETLLYRLVGPTATRRPNPPT
jgi:hypothetical protein